MTKLYRDGRVGMVCVAVNVHFKPEHRSKCWETASIGIHEIMLAYFRLLYRITCTTAGTAGAHSSGYTNNR